MPPAASLLVRAGVGRIRIIDRDFVEPSNLQRQTLFDEPTPAMPFPKPSPPSASCKPSTPAIPSKASSPILTRATLRELLEGFDVILDGTDNFETRFLVNDFAVQVKQPWIYAAAVAATASP